MIRGDPSAILGQLSANGRLFLINPNGILFGSSAVVNTAGLLASTFNITDADFMAGKYVFAQDPTKSLASVINKGTIKVSDNGFVFLVAPGVSNEGLIARSARSCWGPGIASPWTSWAMVSSPIPSTARCWSK